MCDRAYANPQPPLVRFEKRARPIGLAVATDRSRRAARPLSPAIASTAGLDLIAASASAARSGMMEGVVGGAAPPHPQSPRDSNLCSSVQFNAPVTL
jgi:hypothetical protein